MKKLFFLLIFISTLSVAHSQDKIESYGIQIGNWNYVTQNWDFEQLKTCNVDFIIQGNVIIANDEAKSTYYTYNFFTETETSKSWKALDEKNRECIVALSFKYNTRILSVMYDDVIYKYYY
jgi:hypothetical protein